jgi:hypothetical protein
MNEKRQFFTLTSCNEFIIAVGGVYGNVGNFYATFPVSSPLEIYSIEKDQWTSLKNCQIPILKWPGACIFENPYLKTTKESCGDSLTTSMQRLADKKKVFIVGGKTTDSPHHSLSQQSFIVDIVTSEVELVSPPITTRFNPSVFFDTTNDKDFNKIILFGGEDEKYKMAPCIEIYDLKVKQWTEVATIPVSRSYQCISSTSIVQSKIYYLLEEHDGPSSESYILKSASFDIRTWKFEEPVHLPHPSTLASKWCTLVFPNEFLVEASQTNQMNQNQNHLHLNNHFHYNINNNNYSLYNNHHQFNHFNERHQHDVNTSEIKCSNLSYASFYSPINEITSQQREQQWTNHKKELLHRRQSLKQNKSEASTLTGNDVKSNEITQLDNAYKTISKLATSLPTTSSRLVSSPVKIKDESSENDDTDDILLNLMNEQVARSFFAEDCLPPPSKAFQSLTFTNDKSKSSPQISENNKINDKNCSKDGTLSDDNGDGDDDGGSNNELNNSIFYK